MILSTQVKAMNHNNVMNGHKKRLRFQLLRTLNKTSHGKAHFFFSHPTSHHSVAFWIFTLSGSITSSIISLMHQNYIKHIVQSCVNFSAS